MKRERWLWVIGAAAALGVFILYLRYQKPEFKMNSEIPYMCIQYGFSYEDYQYNWDEWTGTLLHSDKNAFRIVKNQGELELILARIEYLWKQTSTADLTFDESFFENNALLLVEVCEDPSTVTVARPENLKEENGRVALTVRWGSNFASVAGNSGSLLLIPISADCTEADVEFEFQRWKGLND